MSTECKICIHIINVVNTVVFNLVPVGNFRYYIFS